MMNDTDAARYVRRITDRPGCAGRATTLVTGAQAMELAADGFTAYPVSGDDTAVWIGR